MATQYGQTVITLSDHVRKFSLKQGNTKAINFIRNLEFAVWAWKELYRKSIWEITTYVLRVDPHSHTITIPGNCERVINVSVVDKFGKIQPLSYNPNLSTVEMLCQKNACSCKSCKGQNSFCAAVENVTALQEIVIINDESYTKITYIKADTCGDIMKEIHSPSWNAETEEVETYVYRELLCNVEVTDKGCIKPTAPNAATLQQYLGINNGALLNNCGYNGGARPPEWNPYRSLIPPAYNYYGDWNWNAACRDIIHIFRSKRNNCTFVNQPDVCNEQCAEEENDIDQVILSCQTIGIVPGEELLIPEYAAMAIDIGMLYQQALFNPRDMDRNNTMRDKWRAEKRNVEQHLNPIRMDDIIKLQTQPHLW